MKNLMIVFLLSFNYTFGQSPAIDSLKNLTNPLFTAGKFEEAMKIYLQILDSATTRKDPCLACDVYYSMSTVYSATENKEAYLSNIHKSQQECLVCNKMKKIARLNRMKGQAKYYEQQFDSAIWYFKLSADQFYAEKDSSKAMISYGQIGNIYEEMEKPKEANLYYKTAYDFMKSKGDKFQMAQAGLKLVNNYNSLKDGPKAMELITETEPLIRASGDYQMLAFIMEYKAIALYLMHKNDEAFHTYQQYMKFYKDTLVTEDLNAEIENLKAKYETEKNEALLVSKDEKINNQKRQIWGIIALLLLSSSIGYFLYSLNKKLNKSNKDKEFLIKEIHHRVKNNLQVLSSLLHLQSQYIKDEAALDAMREGQNRVDAMGLIHQKLYVGNNLSAINMKDYLPKLADSLLDSFGKTDSDITLNFDIENIDLDVDKAIPMGLIVNELITNSLKYAYPKGVKGSLNVKFKHEADGKILLSVSDQGEGEHHVKSGTSFGTSLIDMLVKKLKGQLQVNKDQGYHTSIYFNQSLTNHTVNE